MKSHYILSLLFAFATIASFAQDEKLLDQLLVDEQSAIEAIALYPEQNRLSILEAASHPEILVRLQNLQMKTQSDFQGLIATLTDDEQKRIYNLSRYPDLIQTMAEPQRRISKNKMEALVVGYPEDIQNDAIYFNKNHYQLIADIEYLYRVSDQTFRETIEPYPAGVKQAYHELMRLPEIMSILTNNLNTTVLLGDMYKRDPEKVKSELDSLNTVVAEQKAKELQEWQESLQNDPQALAEYEQATRDFAAEQGYVETDYNRETNDPYTSNVTVHYIWQPYPYWFGCPWWHPYNCWYPYPYWYHSGYYYGPNNVIVFIGMPSYHFVYWYYYSDYRHRHFYHYPHFTNHLMTYHRHHPHANTSVNVMTDVWIADHKEALPNNWMDDNGRVERIKEYGKFNLDYEKAKNESVGKQITERDFLKEHEKDYPTMRPVLKEKKEPIAKPEQKPRTEPVKRPTSEKTKVVTRPETERQVIERAKTHHENTWERSRPPVQQRPVIQPKTRPTTVKPTIKRPTQPTTPVKRPARPVKKGG